MFENAYVDMKLKFIEDLNSSNVQTCINIDDWSPIVIYIELDCHARLPSKINVLASKSNPFLDKIELIHGHLWAQREAKTIN